MINSNYYVVLLASLSTSSGVHFLNSYLYSCKEHEKLTEMFSIQGDLYMYQATTSQTSRAANLIRRMLKFKLLVDSQALEPMSVNKTVPMCMTQVGVLLPGDGGREGGLRPIWSG